MYRRDGSNNGPELSYRPAGHFERLGFAIYPVIWEKRGDSYYSRCSIQSLSDGGGICPLFRVATHFDLVAQEVILLSFYFSAFWYPFLNLFIHFLPDQFLAFC